MARTLEAYLGHIPLLHTWDRGRTWNSGGFNAAQLRSMYRIISERFEHPRVIETGAGNSTITFLHLDPERVVSIAPDLELRDRIVEYCEGAGITTDRLDFRVARSETELPAVALAEPEPQFDVALIDGGHGWPTVFVDFCYLNMLLANASLLFLDDLQLHSVAELARLLERQPGFELLEQWGKLQVWRKETDERFLPPHSRQPYIIERSRPRRSAGRERRLPFGRRSLA
jgi:hypothetical protein